MYRLLLAPLVAGMLLGSTAPATAQNNRPTPLVIGTTQVFTLRVGDVVNRQRYSVRERINHVQDVFAKHLGGQYGQFTTKTWGDRVHIYLNGDFVIGVSPADASATGYKSAQELAPVWVSALRRGFESSHTRSTSR